MKKNKIIFITLSLLASNSVFSTPLLDKGDTGGSADPGIITALSLAFSSPINISVNPDKSVDINFALDQGRVKVLLVSKLGQVCYEKYIDTSIENTLNLNTRCLPSGVYEFVVKDSENITITIETIFVN